MRRIIGLILIVALTIAASLASSFRDTLWAGYRDYVSPYLAELPAGPPRLALSPRIVVVLVRALRMDASRQMGTLNDLRRRGADVTLMLDTPTYRLPRWLTLISGASVQVHGVTNNYPPRLGSADTLVRQAQANGRNTAFIGSQQFDEVLGAGAGRFELTEGLDMNDRDDLAITATLAVLNDPVSPASLVFTELALLEESARFGQRGYEIAVNATDRRLRALLDAIDLNTTTLIVVSDRGVIFGPNGALDGGDETEVARVPMVLAGAGIQPNSQALINATDFAPTLAALAGAPMPVHAQGQIALSVLNIGSAAVADTDVPPILNELMWASAAQLATFYERWSEIANTPRFAAEVLRLHESRIRNGEVAAYQSFVMSVTAQAQAAREGRLAAERTRRLPALMGAGLLALAVVLVMIGRRMWQPLAGAALYLPAWYAFAYFARGDRLSLSMFADSNPALFFADFERSAAISLGVLCLLVAATTGEQEDGLEAISTVMNTLALVMCAHLVVMMWFYWQWNVDFTWNLPASSALVMSLTALSHTSALSVQVSPTLPNLPVPLIAAIVALVVYGLARQRAERNRQRWWR